MERVLQKFDIELDDLLEPAGALEARLVRSQLPDEAVRAFEQLRAALESGYEALGRSAAEIDPTLARPVQGAKNQALTGVQDIERKLLQHLKRRQEIELGQIAKARAMVLPDNKPQERVLTVAPFLARYGPGLLIEFSEAIEAWYASALEGRPESVIDSTHVDHRAHPPGGTADPDHGDRGGLAHRPSAGAPA